MTPLLSIVVPTRDRPETALPCLRELAALIGDDLEIVVSDCGEATSLRDPILALGDLRIRYAKVDPCSMTDNFNHGYAMSRGRYVTFIGDDDIFVPSGLVTLRSLAQSGVEAIAYPHRTCYFWDSFPVREQAGKLFLYDVPPQREGPAEVSYVSAHAAMQCVLDGSQAPPLPVIYHGIVSRTVLERIVSRHGKLFDTPAPDTFVSAALCCVLESYCVVDLPMTVYGKSGVSNSARVLDKTDVTHRLQFRPEERLWDALIPPVETVETHVSHSYLAAFRAMRQPALEAAVMRRYLGDVYALSLLRNPGRAGSILAHLGKAAASDRRIANTAFAQAFVGRVIERLRSRIGGRIAAASPATVVVPVSSLSAAIDAIERAFGTET